MIKGIFFDVDGTLVPPHGKAISDPLRADLLALRERGIKIFICTGRAKQDLASTGMLRDVGFDAYVTLNGQCCFDDREIYRDIPIPAEDLKNAIRVLRDNPGIAALMESNGASRINLVDDRVERVFRFLHTPIYPLAEPEWVLEQNIYQFVPLVDESEEELFFSVMPHCGHTRWHPEGVDLLPKGGRKADGVRATMERFGLEREEIMAFGDGENDDVVLSMAGLSVCMGNGVERIKAMADYVTGSVWEDGICQALRHFGLLD